MASAQFRALSVLLLRRVILAAALVTVIAASLQAYFTLREERAAFDKAVQEIGQSSVPLLSEALWDIEPGSVRLHLEGMVARPEIAYARLDERTGHVFEAGALRARETKTANHLDVPYPDGRNGTLGMLEISPNRSALVQRVAMKVLMTVGGYLLLSVVICLLVAAVLRMELEAPMRHLARFTTELTPTRLTTPLELPRRRRAWMDEIDLVAQGFRTLQNAIHAHVQGLDQQVAQRTAELERAVEEIRALTVTDALTGCFNRRYLDERLAEEVLRSQRAGHALAVIVTDLDHFKKINDSHGHAAGDAVLREIAKIYQSAMRAHVDWVARFGGEEFVIVLPDTVQDGARAVAERLRFSVEIADLTHLGVKIRMSASFGISTCRADDTPATLLARADAALYIAKSQGRNRVLAG